MNPIMPEYSSIDVREVSRNKRNGSLKYINSPRIS